MGTDCQNEANRENAKRSTGPKSRAGKARVARNAIKHGVFCNVPVLSTEHRSEWEWFRADVVENLSVASAIEVTLAERVALLLWRMGRVARYEALVTAAAIERVELPPEPSMFDMPNFGRVPTTDATVLSQRAAREERAKVWERDAAILPNDAAERKVTRYETHLARQLQITLLQLRMLQAGRSATATSSPTSQVLPPRTEAESTGG